MVAKQKIEYNPLFSKEMAATIRKNTKECDTSCRAIKSTLLSLYPNEQETIEKVWRKGKRKIISFALRKMESEGDNVNIELIQVLANARSFMKNINDSMYHSLLDIKISSLNLPKMTLSNEPEKVVGKNKGIWRPFDV
uniref:Transposase n=1 Tax=Strongyloides venezuelensis TaxID=75913 RepID=A0A0K0FR86_STRVS